MAVITVAMPSSNVTIPRIINRNWQPVKSTCEDRQRNYSDTILPLFRLTGPNMAIKLINRHKAAVRPKV